MTSSFNDREKEFLVRDVLNGILNGAAMLKNASRQFFRNHPTTEVQFNVLLLLKYAEHPMTQKELSERLFVDKSTLTGLVDRMESAGHLLRIRPETDRRSYHLQLTDKAEQLLEELERPYGELLNSMLGEFSQEELVTVVRMMNKLQLALDNRCGCSRAHLPDEGCKKEFRP